MAATQTVTLSVEQGLATLRLGREHGNAINGALVRDLLAACERAASDPEVRGVLLAASGKLFCPGLDLRELVELDRPAMERFLGEFNRLVLALYGFPKPLVAAVHGAAVAGGLILALTADWRVLAEGAAVGLNEVKVGVPFPYGVALILREAVPPGRLAEVALLGKNWSGAAAVDAGLVHEVHPAEDFAAHCRLRLAELAGKDPRAFATTKRYLRSVVVERMRAHDVGLAHEFLDGWFAPATHERLRAIAAELSSR